MISAFLLAALLPAWSSAISAALPVWELVGTSNRVILMGSIHYLRAEDYPLPTGLMGVYEDADVIYMELDMDDMNPFTAQLVMTELGTDPQGRNLKELLGSTVYREASQKAGALGLDLTLVDGHEPWFAALLITQLRLMMLGFDPSIGVEQTFLQKAQADRKEIRGLETMEAQLAALDKLSLSAQRSFLIQTLDEAADVTSEMEDIVSAWKRGDASAMEKSMLKGMEDSPEVYDSLLVQRNRDWAGQIRELANDSEDYLIIVGTMHLVGKDSVQRMLEDSGYRTRQLNAR